MSRERRRADERTDGLIVADRCGGNSGTNREVRHVTSDVHSGRKEGTGAAFARNMTSGARKPRITDDGLTLNAARESEQQLRERARPWRLWFALLVFLATLVSDRLYLCADAELTESQPGEPNDAPVSPGNSTWRAETCRADGGASRSCFTLSDADLLCSALFTPELNPGDLYLSFCSAYSLMDLLYGPNSPDHLNCSVDALASGDPFHCSMCVQAYQRYDLHAHEKYEEFESMASRYETDEYSVRTCMDECKVCTKH